MIHEKSDRLVKLEQTLRAINPKRVLERGYSIVENEAGVIKDASLLDLHDCIKVSFASGQVRAEVVEK